MMTIIPTRLTSLIRHAVRSVRDIARGETAHTMFDIYDPRVLFPLLDHYGVQRPTPQIDTIVDVPSAVRYLVGVRMQGGNRGGHTLFSSGIDGILIQRLMANPHMNSTAIQWIAAAFARHLSQRVHRVYELRYDLRQVFPFALTPHGRGGYFEWLLAHGRTVFGLQDEEILWHLFEMDEAPDRGLVATWSLQPSWQQAVPNGITAEGWPQLIRYLTGLGLSGRWLQTARYVPSMTTHDEQLLDRRDTQVVGGGGATTTQGVNFLAHYRYLSGLQEVAVAAVRGLEQHKLSVAKRDLPVRFSCDWRDRERYRSVEVHDTSIVCAAVNTFFDEFLPQSGLHLREGVRRIAIWYWELDQLPSAWVERIEQSQLVDEIWAPTRFIADTFQRHFRIPVIPMLPGLELPAYSPMDRSIFQVDSSKYMFLFMFDMNSSMTRKNPLALIEAYRRAFRSDDGVELVIKVSRADSDPERRAELVNACTLAGVTLIDAVITREQVLGLIASCDAYISLHRSEGLGLSMAEAMLMGKPTIATGYSGNLDFMTPDISYLVDYELVPLAEDSLVYPKGCQWAEPSIDHAAHWMRSVYEHRDEARAMGLRAQSALQSRLAIHAAGERMVTRLRAIGSIN